MRPEPATRRPRKRWPNEQQPLSLRIGAIRDELDARSDGTNAEYRRVIMRDLQRYYQLLQDEMIQYDYIETARKAFARFIMEPETMKATRACHIAHIDALERARILVDHAGLSVDAALVSVGLVKDATAMTCNESATEHSHE